MNAPDKPIDDASLPLWPSLGLIVALGICGAFLLLSPSRPRSARSEDVETGAAPELSRRLQDVIDRVEREKHRRKTPIERIHFKTDAPTDADLEAISAIASVKGVEIESKQVTERGLQFLARLPALIFLRCGHSGTSDEGFKVLRSLQGLKSLDIHDSSFGDEALFALGGLPDLSYLSLTNTAVTDHGFQRLQSLPALQDLSLYYIPTSPATAEPADFSLTRLSAFPNLKAVQLSGVRLRDEFFAELPKCGKLESLELRVAELTPDNCRSLAQCKTLKHLDLASLSIGGSHLKELVKSPALEILSFRDSNIQIEDLVHLKQLSHLYGCKVRSQAASETVMDTHMREVLPGLPLPRCGGVVPEPSYWSWIFGS